MVYIDSSQNDFSKLIKLGISCRDNGNYNEAISHYEKALQIRDTDSNLHADLGICYQKIGALPKSIEAFKKAVELNNKNNFAIEHLFKIYLKDKNYDLVKYYGQLLLAQDKLDVFLVPRIARLAYKFEDIIFLKILYDKYKTNLSVSNHYIKLLTKNDCHQLAEDIIHEGLINFQSDEKYFKQLICKLIQVYFAAEKYDLARDLILEYHKKFPDAYVFLKELSIYAILTGKFELAVSLISKSLSRKPHSFNLIELLINIYHVTGNKEEELALIKRLEISANNEKFKESLRPFLINTLIRCLEINGDFISANAYRKFGGQNDVPSKKELFTKNDDYQQEKHDDTEEVQRADDDITQMHIEGSKKQITVNIYERNPFARRLCIAYHGPICFICGFNFEMTYGEIFKGKIHVHHIKALYEISEEYEVDPINDMIPVCPNCHFVFHSKKPPYSPSEMKSIYINKSISNLRVNIRNA